MTRPLTVPLALALAACQPGPTPVDPKTPEPAPKSGQAGDLRLVQSGESWYVTGMNANAASMVEQGRLFAALQPIEGTPDLRAVAVLKTLGPAVGSSVQVASRSRRVGVRGRTLFRGLGGVVGVDLYRLDQLDGSDPGHTAS